MKKSTSENNCRALLARAVGSLEDCYEHHLLTDGSRSDVRRQLINEIRFYLGPHMGKAIAPRAAAPAAAEPPKMAGDTELRIKAGKGPERVMFDTPETLAYLRKLSYASVVRITWPDGHWAEWECGEAIKTSPVHCFSCNQDGQHHPDCEWASKSAS